MQIVNADSRNSERAMESATEREAEILTTDYRMNADRGPSKCGMRNGELIPPSSRRCALPQSPPGEGAARGHVGQPKLIGIGAVELKNVRLCSPMFAYVRLCSLDRKKNVEGAARGHRGCCARPLLGNAKCTTDGSRQIKIRQIKAN